MRTAHLLALCGLISVALCIATSESHIHDFTPAHITNETIFARVDGSVRTISEILPPRPNNGKRFHDPKQRVSVDPFGPMPKFAGAIQVGQPLKWAGGCFQQMTGSIELPATGGFNLHINAANPKSLTCTEWIIFSTSSRFIFHLFAMRGDHTIKVGSWKGDGEQADVQLNGVRLFEVFNASVITTLTELYEFYEDFVADNKKTEAELIQTHKDYFDYTFRARDPVTLTIPDSAVQSGDVFLLHHLTNEQLEYWYLTGGHAGHACIALWHEGKLYVCEVTDSPFLPIGPPYGYQMTPFQDWIKDYVGAGYEITWLHLRADLAATFKQNEDKAYQFWYSHRREWYAPSYAYVAWDTARDNISPPLTPESAILLITLMENLDKAEIQGYLFDALNMRFQQYYHLDADCTSMQCLLNLAALVNSSIFDVMALPEIDGWVYPKGVSIVCAGLATHMLRAAGVFGDLQFNAGEIHPRDLGALKIYDDVWADRPEGCSKSTGYCQIAGRFWVDFPDFNTVDPHAHMYEKCGGQAPHYDYFPKGC